MSLLNLYYPYLPWSRGYSSIYHYGNSEYFTQTKRTKDKDYLITIEQLDPYKKTLYYDLLIIISNNLTGIDGRWGSEIDANISKILIQLIEEYNEVDILDKLKSEVKGWLKDVCKK